MAVTISQEIAEIFADKESIKVLASVDEHGVPHVVVKSSLYINEEGQIVYLEFFEKSVTNRNLTHSLWFNRTVAVNVTSRDGRSFQLKGVPYKSLVSGREYLKFYTESEKLDPDNDLVAVYIIEPTEIREQTYQHRIKEEREKHPLYIHLDKLAKESEEN